MAFKQLLFTMLEAKSLVPKAADYVKKQLSKEKTGHDWAHVYRVWQMAKFMQSIEGGDLELIELAALLHSATEQNYKKTEDEGFRTLAMRGMLDVLEIPGSLKEKIIDIANETRYLGTETVRPKTIESKIVQDANWLDGLGAVGIARVFTAGGFLGRPIFDPDIETVPHVSNEQFQKRKKEGTSLNYFYEKSMVIASLLNTETAKKIAKKRMEFMKLYLDTFMREWNREDLK